MPNYIMSFGLHRGKDISLVPRSYLKWIQNEDEDEKKDWVQKKYPDLIEAIDEEIQQRERSYDDF